MIVVLAGSGDWVNVPLVIERLQELPEVKTVRVAVTADEFYETARACARMVGAVAERFFLDHGRYGVHAHARAVEEMVDTLPRPDAVLVFTLPEYTGANAHKQRPGSEQAEHCARYALAARLSVRRTRVDGRVEDLHPVPTRRRRAVARAS